MEVYVGPNLYSGTRAIDALTYREELENGRSARTLAVILKDYALIFSLIKGRAE